MFDGILLIENEGEASVVDNVADTVDVVLLPCLVVHYLEEGFAIWLSLDGQMLINSHEFSRNHNALTHLQRNNSIVVDKIVLSDN